MARERSPNRKKALVLWFESGKEMKPSEIAEKLGINAALVRKWKSIDKWDEQPEPRPGAPKGNRNAVGNKGGHGGPAGNDKAVKHGLFRKFLPDDEETQEIYDMTNEMTSLDILWEGIRIQLTNIIRALKVMHVTGKDEMIKELKKQKFEVHSKGKGDKKELIPVVIEEEYEFQFSWDRSATGLKAMSAAWTSLTRTIKQYEETLRMASPEEVKEEQRQRVEQIKASISVMKSKVPNSNPIDMNKQITALADLINNPVQERVNEND
ncbi:phage terminase small subunit [Paenibacillus sp. FSL K6-2524]|uniref:phage terminase small subunit n=1 Tax=Paenibacillus sp. FSL K6-2524 TaxID=2954516 RepID=UPI0030FA257C